jgi:hypothetical protein
MDKVSERVFEVALVLVAVVLAAAGVTGAVVAAVGIGGCVLILLVVAGVRFIGARQRTRLPMVTSTPSAPVTAASAERYRLLRMGAEAPEKRSEREALLRDARQVARTYRAMTDLHGIRDADPEARASWLDRVIGLHRRLGDYADRWQVVLPDASQFTPLVPPVEPDWLEAMAHDADAIAWQVDHEDGGRVRHHELATVGGTRTTCTCGMSFNTGTAFNAHLASSNG